MNTPKSALRTTLQRLVLATFACTTALIALLLGEVILSITGLTFDPHGYGIFAGILSAAMLTPIALALWLLYRTMRRHGN
ncbi:hypothetical protein DFR70_11962 [Nocardia tenerifensis]|uniref:Uncharacterized protein n=1 Tax=Nocardia tenerifensis TaxID=228006 RepID=A0A318K3D3_9NOCA|nr:hypothetical protein [Nocardia tenerifensis]PXX56510.1 hypothetical protein DFR70_11962 [Nocardia tenerifensis]